MVKTRKKATKKAPATLALVRSVIEGIEEKKGSDIITINLRKIPNHACDYFIICEGNSRTQVQAIAGSVEETVEKKTGSRPWHVEGLENGEWVLLDYVDVAVHIFQPEIRGFYNLESMWADAEVTKGSEIKTPAKKKTKRNVAVKKKKPAAKKNLKKKK